MLCEECNNDGHILAEKFVSYASTCLVAKGMIISWFVVPCIGRCHAVGPEEVSTLIIYPATASFFKVTCSTYCLI